MTLNRINGFLPDGTIVNNLICDFVSSSKPNMRVDGSALITNDRWFNPTTGIFARWNGTYWLSLPLTAVSGTIHMSTSNDSFNAVMSPIKTSDGTIVTTNSIFIHTAGLVGFIQSVDSSNYWRLQMLGISVSGAGRYGSPRDIIAGTNDIYTEVIANYVSRGHFNQSVSCTKIGLPSNIQVMTYVNYSWIL